MRRHRMGVNAEELLDGGGERKSKDFILFSPPHPQDFMEFMQNSRLLRSRRAGGGCGHTDCFLVNAEQFRETVKKNESFLVIFFRKERLEAISTNTHSECPQAPLTPRGRSLRRHRMGVNAEELLDGGGERKSKDFILFSPPHPQDFMEFMQNSRLLRSRRAGGGCGHTDCFLVNAEQFRETVKYPTFFYIGLFCCF